MRFLRARSFQRPLLLALVLTCQAAGADPLDDAQAAARRSDYAAFLSIVRPLAEQGNAKAQQWLGVSYQLGQGVPRDYAEALKWFRRSAAQQNADAQVNIGYLYSMGLGVKQDNKEGLRWYVMAARQGNAIAQFNVGSAYRNGNGVGRDDAQAVKWFRQAAVQGNDPGQCGLGEMYYRGRGTEQDLVRAYMWLSLCSGSPNARFFPSRDLVAKNMTAGQIAAAQKLGNECRERQFKDCR
ncbi:MAG TPA: tetratricopeptide repeat protein [Steroidobacteraceae bacterium]|nr:tetratricopeptide repeat protein [Steroidobacteraceae bacterium]